jgi:predicted glycosyl hydrolase (DUF1957 family)
MKEYTVKVKDFRQNITHTVHQLASSKPEANYVVLAYLRNIFGYDDFEIV